MFLWTKESPLKWNSSEKVIKKERERHQGEPVGVDLRDESAVSQKGKHENTILKATPLQPHSNLEQNRLLLS